MTGRRRARPAALLALGLGVAGCATTPPVTNTVVSASGAPGVGPGLNAARAAQGLALVASSPALTAAAVSQARYMAARGTVTHRSQGNATAQDRVRAQGYDACMTAENIAARQRTVAEVTQGWLTSPGHRANMLRSDATHWGAGSAVTADGTPYWVVVLARRC